MSKTIELEAHKWRRPDSYIGASWPDYYVAAGRSRDSDALEESNFRVALRRLGGETGESVIVVRENHWAVGWVEWIGVHKDNAAGLEALREILEALDSYPVLDEEDFYTEERERAFQGLTNCYNLTQEEADKVAEWCENNNYVLEGENYMNEGIEKAKEALGIG